MRGLTMPALAAILAVGTLGSVRVAQAISPGSQHQLVANMMMNGIVLSASEIANEWIEPPQWGVPGGDYQQTCRDIRTNGSLLTARCQKRDGGWRSTSIDTRTCRRGMINDNGFLRCAEGPGYGGNPGYGRPPAWGGGIPPGDYRRTCSNIRVSGQRLDATCQKVNGGWRNTSLDNYYRCGNQISNVDGHLRCGR